MHTYKRTYIHTYIHTDIHTYIYHYTKMFNMSDINRSSVKVKIARTKLSTLEDISVKKN